MWSDNLHLGSDWPVGSLIKLSLPVHVFALLVLKTQASLTSNSLGHKPSHIVSINVSINVD